MKTKFFLKSISMHNFNTEFTHTVDEIFIYLLRARSTGVLQPFYYCDFAFHSIALFFFFNITFKVLQKVAKCKNVTFILSLYFGKCFAFVESFFFIYFEIVFLLFLGISPLDFSQARCIILKSCEGLNDFQICHLHFTYRK